MRTRLSICAKKARFVSARDALHIAERATLSLRPYVRIEMALLATGCNLFSGSELPPEEALRDMTVDQAIHILHMHKHEARGIGGRPGLVARIPAFADVSEGIRKKIDIIVRARALCS